MWDRFFDLDNVVWRTIDKIGKIFLLNLLWLICSLPVFTIGGIDDRSDLHQHEAFGQ